MFAQVTAYFCALRKQETMKDELQTTNQEVGACLHKLLHVSVC